jgi:hypothetical protein
MDLLPGIDQKVDLFRDGNLARTDMPTALRDVRYRGATRKTSAPSEYFAFCEGFRMPAHD